MLSEHLINLTEAITERKALKVTENRTQTEAETEEEP
jgi:hypothetical protein